MYDARAEGTCVNYPRVVRIMNLNQLPGNILFISLGEERVEEGAGLRKRLEMVD